MLDGNMNASFQYASIVGLSNILSVKTSEMLVPDLSNETFNSLKNIFVHGGLTGTINSALQMALSKDILYLENAFIGAGASVAAILVEPTLKNII